jgi:predicted acyl esterase
MVAADIIRLGYPEDPETAKAIPPGRGACGPVRPPTAKQLFLPGRRLMVQVQSTWFPLYDRNPQTFVLNIFWAKPGDFARAAQWVFRALCLTSFVGLRVIPLG